jgi:hypothetical protein
VPTRLQHAPKLDVLDEAGPEGGLVDHEGRSGEVSRRLVAGEWCCELLGEAQHGTAVGFLARIPCDVRPQKPAERLLPRHSYCSACRTLSRAARLAGKIAARIPTTIAITPKTISENTGSENTMKSTR